ncbi:MAG TPA: avidin/streptavidin family protein [Acidisphaera sp.]|nr:avidin/streptavidin family protein [Acidisphaera sp.]
MRTAIAAVLIALGLVSSAFAQGLTAPSVWKNQRGSELDITSVGADGTIVGTFTNNAAGFQCRGTKFDVSGLVLTKGLFFAVAFGPCYSIVSWHGDVQGSTMATTWELHHVVAADGTITTLTGADTFTLVPR